MISFSLNLPKYIKYPLVFSSGELAQLANASTKVAFDGTVVLVTACMSSDPKEGVDFLPLTVDYRQKNYAMGKIPGGFFKREGRPTTDEIMKARLIDRTIRPFFPQGTRNEIQIMAMTLSSNGKNDPDVLAINGAICCLLASDIPFAVPIGAVRVSKSQDGFIINPTYEERKNSLMDIVLAGTENKIVMIEGCSRELAETDLLEAIRFAYPVIKEIIRIQLEICDKIGKEKIKLVEKSIDKDLLETIEEKISPRLEEIYKLTDKLDKEKIIGGIVSEIEDKFKERDDITKRIINDAFNSKERIFVRNKILGGSARPDGRSLEEVRFINCKVGVLPYTHGSALFNRGKTQSLSIVTLGGSSDEQTIESLEGRSSKHFMLHYNFPPFSVGEVRPVRGSSRREIGHGMLAEKSLYSFIPAIDAFPYTIRVVSEILASNGSSSMATVCAASLALMDAGVPLEKMVAGIAIGLIEGKDNYKILTDIAGSEDHYGDMDFKVAGTDKGITAIQVDVKNSGLTLAIISETLERAKTARLFILNKMKAVLSKSRDGVSAYAPRIKSFVVNPEKIGAVIGPGGKVIKKLSRDYNVDIDIDDETNRISVTASDEEGLAKAVNNILILTRDINVGDIYEVKVVKLTNFGAFCELAPGKDGLLHVSELSNEFIKDIRDFLKEGDIIKVKVINVSTDGKISLSKKRAE